MGLWDKAIQRLATQIAKAPVADGNGAIMSMREMTQNAGIAQQQYGNVSTALPRNPLLSNVPFAPGMPIYPGAINPLRPDTGRPDPRRYEFQVAQNINVSDNRLIPFKTLRAAADQIDIVRRCIEVRKAKLTGLKWDIVLSEAATEMIIAESGGDHLNALAKARETLSPEIGRMKKFWQTPDPQNGLSFIDWLNMALEEIDVLDAWAIWPQVTVGGEIRGFQILDGSTIKPLLDDRGMRPEPSSGPAFQQILFGFPRSEFNAGIDDEDADGEFTSDDLAYFVRNRRANSVYGMSPVERCLPVASIYLLRQQWIRSEFTDGTMPKSYLELPETSTLTPDQIRAYEDIYNDDLSGQTAQRNRLRILVPGGKMLFEEGYSDKFSDAMDNYLVTAICGHFGVLPSEIGINGAGGLGASGIQQGESDSAESIGIIPTANWISEMISALSHRFLGMPRELTFKLAPSERTNTQETALREDVRRKNGAMTLNEHRSELGLPLIETPEADMPMVVAGTGAFFFGPDGIVPAVEAQPMMGMPLGEEELVEETEVKPDEEPKEEIKEEIKPEDKPAKAEEEVKKFIRWIRKGQPTRSFEFIDLDPTYADVLNKFIETKDVDSARWYAEHYLGI